MSDDLIQRALDQIARHEAEAAKLKAWVNEADKMLGQEPRFASIEASFGPTGLATSNGRPPSRRWAEGTFFNKPLAGAVRQVLEAAQEAAGGPAPLSVDELYDALSQGSYDFGAGDTESRKQGIRISLGKNSVTFVKLPNSDKFGLVDWYGTRPLKRRRIFSTDRPVEASADADATDDDGDVGSEEAAAELPAADISARG